MAGRAQDVNEVPLKGRKVLCRQTLDRLPAKFSLSKMMRGKWLLSITWPLLGISSVFPFTQSITIIQNKRPSVQYSVTPLGAATRNPLDFDCAHNIKLPVFPLRKVARLPSEQITLNLYEERYLVMADYILSQRSGLQPPIFGALFVGGKPQFVKQGKGPIVPMVRKGDVGVIFVVEDSEIGLIPTIGGTNRRRTRLVATGVARFEITRVLENGFDGADDALPFILVDSRLVLDDKENGDEEELLSELRERILNSLNQSQKDDSMEEEGASTRPQRYLELISSLSRIFQGNIKKEEKEIFCRALEIELLVFATIARTMPDNATAKRLEALRARKHQVRDFQL